MDWETAVGLISVVTIAVAALWLVNKFIVKLFEFIASTTIILSVLAVLFPPYKLEVPKLIGLNIGRHPAWSGPSSTDISLYLPSKYEAILPKLVSDDNLSLFITVDHVGLIANLASIFLIYLIALSAYIVQRNET